MKTSFSTKNTDAVIATLEAKLRLKRHKVDRLRGMLWHLETECERLEGEIRRRSC